MTPYRHVCKQYGITEELWGLLNYVTDMMTLLYFGDRPAYMRILGKIIALRLDPLHTEVPPMYSRGGGICYILSRMRPRDARPYILKEYPTLPFCMNCEYPRVYHSKTGVCIFK